MESVSTAAPRLGHDPGVRPALLVQVAWSSALSAALVIAACGGRTSLERSGEGSPLADASDEPEGDGGDGGPAGGYVYCDMTRGPLPPSEVPEGSFIRRCDDTFSHCVDIGGQWACCNGPGPYDGPTGSCLF